MITSFYLILLYGQTSELRMQFSRCLSLSRICSSLVMPCASTCSGPKLIMLWVCRIAYMCLQIRSNKWDHGLEI